jgi:hypothetical protein
LFSYRLRDKEWVILLYVFVPLKQVQRQERIPLLSDLVIPLFDKRYYRIFYIFSDVLYGL